MSEEMAQAHMACSSLPCFSQLALPEIVKALLRERGVIGLRENLVGSYPS